MKSHLTTSSVSHDALEGQEHVPSDLAIQKARSETNESLFALNGWRRGSGEVPEGLPKDIPTGEIVTVAWPMPFADETVFFFRQGQQRATPLARRWREYRVYTKTEQGWQRDHMEFA